MSDILCALLRVQVSLNDRLSKSSRCQQTYTDENLLCTDTEMLCRSCDAELRLGLAIAEGLGEKLLWSVNTKKVQSKQYLTARSILECVFRILKRHNQTALQHVYHHFVYCGRLC